jgi:hypothetical protein
MLRAELDEERRVELEKRGRKGKRPRSSAPRKIRRDYLADVVRGRVLLQFLFCPVSLSTFPSS